MSAPAYARNMCILSGKQGQMTKRTTKLIPKNILFFFKKCLLYCNISYPFRGAAEQATVI